MATNLLEGLNDEQRQAAMHDAGPLLIVAGAGTGKTTVITRRIAWLIEQKKCKPDEILALTFTDKAANEMEERVDRLVPYGYVNLWISTFHGFCERVVKQHALDIGLAPDFTLLDTTSTWLLMRKNLDRFNLEYYRPLGNPTKFIHALIQHFSRAKDEVIDPKQYGEYAGGLPVVVPEGGGEIGVGDEVQRIQEIAAAYQLYEQILLESNALDFGGLIQHAIRLFRQRPAILEKYHTQFKYMLVDEFQDTNLAQYELIKLLAAPRNNLTVCGDDDQSIYKFRGASVANILQFNTDFPDAKQVFLAQNYRSPQNILDAAYGFIQQNNPNRLEYQLQQSLQEGEVGTMSKRLISALQEVGTFEHLHCATLDDEVGAVIQKIAALKEENPVLEWGDFAILSRSNDAADPFMVRLNELQIPYHFVALKGLYAKPAIVDLICYLKLLDNFHEGAAMYRVLSWSLWNVPHTSIVELSHYAYKKALTLWSAIQVIDTIADIPESDRDVIKAIAAGIEKLCTKAKTLRIAELCLHVLKDTGYLAAISDPQTDQERDALSAINQFYSKIKQFQVENPNGRLKDFMILLSLEQDSGETGSLARDEDLGPDTVKVMTIHSAKGLEFPYVFLVNMVDKRFPTIQRNDAIPLPTGLVQEQASSDTAHLEEERRLMYVALTRAKKGFFFSSAIDYGGSRKKKLSRFVHELGFAVPMAEQNSHDLLAAPKSSAQKTGQPRPKLPAVYSFSQLMAFRTCPLQYKFSFLLRIPVFGKPAFSFGKSMHATLEKLFRLLIDSRTQPVTIPSLEEVLVLYEKNWIGDWFPSKKLHDEYFERGKEMIQRLHADLVVSPPSPVDVERDFVIKIGSDAQHFTLKGRIDRIDRAENGTIEIVDYKTGASKAGKLTAEDKEQLLLYQLAAEQTMGEKVDSLTYQYLDDGSKASFVGSPQDLEKLKTRIHDTISEIQTSDFRATPGWSCQFCDFKDICEYK